MDYRGGRPFERRKPGSNSASTCATRRPANRPCSPAEQVRRHQRTEREQPDDHPSQPGEQGESQAQCLVADRSQRHMSAAVVAKHRRRSITLALPRRPRRWLPSRVAAGIHVKRARRGGARRAVGTGSPRSWSSIFRALSHVVHAGPRSLRCAPGAAGRDRTAGTWSGEGLRGVRHGRAPESRSEETRRHAATLD